MNTGFQIIVPVFNEVDVLQDVLELAAKEDYLHKIIFVDDASTDSSRDILRAWIATHGIDVHFLDETGKKKARYET